MSVTLNTLSHGELQNCGFMGPWTSHIYVGEHEIPTREFAHFAAYVLSGGENGWKEIPAYVREAVDRVKERIGAGGLEERLCKCRVCTYPKEIGESVRIGQYEIATEEFVWFAAYVLGGGIMRWEKVPPYIQRAVKEIEKRLK